MYFTFGNKENGLPSTVDLALKTADDSTLENQKKTARLNARLGSIQTVLNELILKP